MYNINSGRTNAGARVFSWYRLDEVSVIKNRLQPQFTVEKRINRKDCLLHTAHAVSVSNEARFFLTVEYNGVFIPVGLNDFYPYYLDGYAVDVIEESENEITSQFIYLGIEQTQS